MHDRAPYSLMTSPTTQIFFGVITRIWLRVYAYCIFSLRSFNQIDHFFWSPSCWSNRLPATCGQTKLPHSHQTRSLICCPHSKSIYAAPLSWSFGSWLTRLLQDLSVSPSLSIPVHSYSQVAIHIARNPVFHEWTKQVELDCHFVRQQFLAGLISLSFVPSSSQLADLFTKALGGPHFSILSKMGVVSLPSILRRGVGNKNQASEPIEIILCQV